MSHNDLMYDSGLNLNEIAATCLQHMISQFNLNPNFEGDRAMSIEKFFKLYDKLH
jgi:hypothetical protein